MKKYETPELEELLAKTEPLMLDSSLDQKSEANLDGVDPVEGVIEITF